MYNSAFSIENSDFKILYYVENITGTVTTRGGIVPILSRGGLNIYRWKTIFAHVTF